MSAPKSTFNTDLSTVDGLMDYVTLNAPNYQPLTELEVEDLYQRLMDAGMIAEVGSD